MLLLREIFPDDLESLLEVATHLDSVNLPADRDVLRGLIDLSRRSFAGQLDVFKRQYLFALFDRTTGGSGDRDRLIGTSMIHAQHGTRRAPHIFFDVLTDERYSESLDKHVVHQILRIGYNYNGPTEIGGLVLLPEYRGHEAALGRWLSYVRFLYIALHRQNFRDEVLSELMPPLEADGTSLLWESLGRNFTGMSYQEADRISQTNKEFIRTLFPSEPIYTCLLPANVRAMVGQVGPETRGVEKMLRRIGFEYAERIDPFDGGPHFIAATDKISLVQATVRAKIAAERPAGRTQVPQATQPSGPGASTEKVRDPDERQGLVCVERDRAPHFLATGGRFELRARGGDGGRVTVPAEIRALLGVAPGDEVGVLPF